jgi:hypothetical protein
VKLLRGHLWTLAIALIMSERLGLVQTFFLHIGRRTEVLTASVGLTAGFGGGGIIKA